MRGLLVRSVVMAVVASIWTDSAIAQSKCDAGKLKCVRNKFSCLVKVHEASQKKGLPPDPVKLQKCLDKFEGGADPSRGCFAKLEAAAGADCSTTDNVAEIEALVDQDVEDLLAALGLTIPTSTTTTAAPTTTTLPALCTNRFLLGLQCNGNIALLSPMCASQGDCQQALNNCASNPTCSNNLALQCASMGCGTVGSCTALCGEATASCCD